MGLKFDEVKRIKEEFQKQYVFIKPYSDYTSGCGISMIKLLDKNAHCDVADDFCIIVFLRELLPKNLSMPTEYQNVKVFTMVAGKAHLE